MPEERQIFREKSLERLSSPDRLDQLLRIVKPQSWILLAALAGGLLLVLAWSFVGRIPATAQGAAILVRPKQVVSFQSPASGRLRSIEVDVGSAVEKGTVLATLHLPTLETLLEQERAKLKLFQRQSTELTEAEIELADLEKGFLSKQAELLRERIVSVRRSAETYRQKSSDYIDEQRENIRIARRYSDELGKALDERYEAYRSLAEGEAPIVARLSLIEPRTQSINNQLRLAELDVREQELSLRENLTQQAYDEQMDLIKDLGIQLNDLELREMLIDRRLLEGNLKNTSEITEIEARIEELRVRYETESQVLSEHDGQILEVTAALGEQVAIGHRLGKMEIEDASALIAVAYFPIKDGKKINSGFKIRVSPSTVEREREGSMLGRVTRVSDYPVTTEAAANEIGDVEIARALLQGEARIEVRASLDIDDESFTGYAWTSGDGPDSVLITAGTTATARVTIEEVRPITLVLPFLKSMFEE